MAQRQGWAPGTRAGSKLEFLGRRDDEGTAALVIALRKADGRSTLFFLDPTTFLPFTILFEHPQQPIPTAVYVGGWYSEGGIKFHRRSDHYYFSNQQLFESESKMQCELNPPVDETAFAKEPAK
jgi:hypothetical protein